MPEQPVFTQIMQIAVVVKDCDVTVKKYADDYGIVDRHGNFPVWMQLSPS